MAAAPPRRLSAKEVYALMRKAGFPAPQALVMTAIAGFRGSPNPGESGGNPRAHNPKPPDDSYGFLQINMIGALGPARRARFGIKSNEELYDPLTNAKAAYELYKSGGFEHWSVYKSGDFKANLAAAAKAAKQIEKDPGLIDKTVKVVLAGLGPVGAAIGAVTGAKDAVKNVQDAIADATNDLKKTAFMALFGFAGMQLLVMGVSESITGDPLALHKKAVKTGANLATLPLKVAT